MKLYTEEQVIEAIIRAKVSNEYAEEIVKNILSDLTPIELPSDEEIYKNSFKLDVIYWHDGFLAGVDWLINHIKQQDNETVTT